MKRAVKKRRKKQEKTQKTLEGSVLTLEEYGYIYIFMYIYMHNDD
jgi:hypothetical protein